MAELSIDDIRAAYRSILGREADPSGLEHYLAQAAGGLSRQDLIRSMTESEEFRGRTPLPEQLDLGPEGIRQLADALMPHILSRLSDEKPWRHAVFVPSPEVYASPADAPFMPYSTCSGADFLHPRFGEILGSLGLRNELHRKLWEWVFVIHHLIDAGVVRDGSRGLVFGVGRELLPSLFASLGARITATDAPAEIGIDAGWQSTNEYAQALAAMPEGRLDRAEFERLVEWRACDMNAIDPALTGYDFNWSSCCFEHLGSLRQGMDFVIEAVENTLRPGGVAVHTTEFNLSSNDATIEEGVTVLYRRRDIEDLIGELRARGHQVEPFRLAPDTLTMDGYVDQPPYAGPHVKLGLEGYVCTSVGLVIRRGPLA